MIPIILITLGGIFQGIASVIRKHSSTTEHRATTIATTTMLVNALICSPLLLYQFRLSAEPITWVITILSAVLFALSATFFFKSYQHADLSAVTILHRTSIIYIAIFGVIFLHEQISFIGIIGLLLLFLGSTSVLYEQRSMKFTKGAWYSLISALLGAISAVIDKHALNDFSPYTYVFINSLLVGCMFLWQKYAAGISTVYPQVPETNCVFIITGGCRIHHPYGALLDQSGIPDYGSLQNNFLFYPHHFRNHVL